MNEENAEFHKIDYEIVHPLYDGFYHDVMLVHIESASAIQPLELYDGMMTEDEIATVIGWGNTEDPSLGGRSARMSAVKSGNRQLAFGNFGGFEVLDTPGYCVDNNICLEESFGDIDECFYACENEYGDDLYAADFDEFSGDDTCCCSDGCDEFSCSPYTTALVLGNEHPDTTCETEGVGYPDTLRHVKVIGIPCLPIIHTYKR